VDARATPAAAIVIARFEAIGERLKRLANFGETLLMRAQSSAPPKTKRKKMTEYQMAEFFRSLGHQIVQTESCFWYSSQRFLYKNLPIHRNVDPSRTELAKVMLRGAALVVRYPGTPGEVAADGGIYACADRNYDFASLTANARSHTRRGLARTPSSKSISKTSR